MITPLVPSPTNVRLTVDETNIVNLGALSVTGVGIVTDSCHFPLTRVGVVAVIPADMLAIVPVLTLNLTYRNDAPV